MTAEGRLGGFGVARDGPFVDASAVELPADMHLFATSNLLQGIVLGALCLVLAWSLFRTYRYLAKQKRDDSTVVLTTRPRRTDRTHSPDAPPELNRWEVQMHETARDLSAQLDSKMGALQVLIAEADRAAARLEAAIGTSPEPSELPLPPDAKPTTQAETLRSSSASASEVESPEAASERPSARPSREEIHALADRGFDASEIARRVGTPVGEVELILSLYRRE